MSIVDKCGRINNGRTAQFACREPEHRESWVVLQREGNRSAFNGYRWTSSDYSEILCRAGGAIWRTKAAYVRGIPDA